MARVVRKNGQSEEVPETIMEELEEPEPGGLIARFQCYVAGFNGTRADELAITLNVVKEDKYKAFPFTDNRGYIYNVEVRRPPSRREQRQKKVDSFDFTDE